MKLEVASALDTPRLNSPSLDNFVCGLAIFTASTAWSREGRAPAGFEDYLVLMATGSVPIGQPHDVVPGCGEFIFCDGDWFQRNVMRRSPAAIDEEMRKAKSFFNERFGMDADDPANKGRLVFFSFMLDPRGDYRAYTVSGRNVPPEGWVVRDGGFGIQVMDPNGFTMGGEFSGVTAPGDAMVLFGNYNIEVTSGRGTRKRHG